MCQISTPFLQIAAHQLNGAVGFPLTFRCWEKTTHFAEEPKQMNQCVGFFILCFFWLENYDCCPLSLGALSCHFRSWIWQSYLIFVLFSPHTKFLAQFFSTPKRVNSNKTDFATKQRKSHKREILQQNSIRCDKT